MKYVRHEWDKNEIYSGMDEWLHPNKSNDVITYA